MSIISPTPNIEIIVDDFISYATNHLSTVSGIINTISAYPTGPAPGVILWSGYTVPSSGDFIRTGSSSPTEMTTDMAYSISNAYNAINVAGVGILNDESDVSYDIGTTRTVSLLPREVPTSAISRNPTVSRISPAMISAIMNGCTAQPTYDSSLSQNFKVEHLTNRAVFPHTLRPQRGLTVEQIVCNLQHVCQNVLEPIRARYPNMFITSGFRQSDIPEGTRASWHTTGSAVDIQFRGFSPRDYLPVAEWIIQNIPFNTFIFEHGRSIWFHIDLPKITQLGRKVLTMYRGNYESGIKLYYA
jgi:hypothetical protein